MRLSWRLTCSRAARSRRTRFSVALGCPGCLAGITTEDDRLGAAIGEVRVTLAAAARGAARGGTRDLLLVPAPAPRDLLLVPAPAPRVLAGSSAAAQCERAGLFAASPTVASLNISTAAGHLRCRGAKHGSKSNKSQSEFESKCTCSHWLRGAQGPLTAAG